MPKQKTPDEIVATSGNSFHCKVAGAFRSAGWQVTISPYYVDSATDKAREFDLLCERKITWKDDFQQKHVLIHQLFVECKYLTVPTVFWFDIRDHERAKRWLDDHTPFKSDNVNHARQHHMRAGGRVAKLFASGASGEQEPIYKALNQCLGGMTQGSWGRDDNPSLVAQAKAGAPTCSMLQYPVIIVCESAPVFGADVVSGGGPTVPLATNFVLEVNYAYLDSGGRRQQQYFLVDVVRFDQIADFFTGLDEEVEAAKFFLNTN